MDTTPAAIVVHRNEKVLYANPACLKLIKLENLDDLLGKSLFDYLHPDSYKLAKERLAQYTKGTLGENSVEERIIIKDGSIIDVEVIASSIIYQGKPAMQSVFFDISKRKKTEKVLIESKTMLNAFMQSATQSFLLWDSALNLTYINQMGLSLFPPNTQEDDLLGKNILELSYRLKERGRYEQYKQVLKTGTPVFFEDLISNSLGKERNLSIRAFKVGDGLGMTNEDVTEKMNAQRALRESEERYRLLFNSGKDAVFVSMLEENGIPERFIDVNDAACQKLGFSREELLTLSPQKIGLPENSGTVPEGVKVLLRDKYAVFESIHITKDGEEIPVEVHSHLFDLKGRLAILSIARDIAVRKKASSNGICGL